VAEKRRHPAGAALSVIGAREGVKRVASWRLGEVGAFDAFLMPF
jgi:hypothetical protein